MPVLENPGWVLWVYFIALSENLDPQEAVSSWKEFGWSTFKSRCGLRVVRSRLNTIEVGQLYQGISQVALVVKNLPANAGDIRDPGLILRLGRSLGGGTWHPTPVFLPGESHGQRSLAGYSP